MSLEDTLAALGLEDEATVSPRTGGDGGGNSFAIPIGWSGNHRGDLTLTPGQTPFAPGTPGNYLDTVRRAGGPVSATGRGTGTSRGHFNGPTLWAEGLTGTSPDDWCQCSTPHDPPPTLPHCELCSASLLGIGSKYPLSTFVIPATLRI